MITILCISLILSVMLHVWVAFEKLQEVEKILMTVERFPKKFYKSYGEKSLCIFCHSEEKKVHEYSCPLRIVYAYKRLLDRLYGYKD